MENWIIILAAIAVLAFLIAVAIKRDLRKQLRNDNKRRIRLRDADPAEITSLEREAERHAEAYSARFGPAFQQAGYRLVCRVVRLHTGTGQLDRTLSWDDSNYLSGLALYVSRPEDDQKPLDWDKFRSTFNIWEVQATSFSKTGVLTLFSGPEIREYLDREIRRYAAELGLSLPR